MYVGALLRVVTGVECFCHQFPRPELSRMILDRDQAMAGRKKRLNDINADMSGR